MLDESTSSRFAVLRSVVGICGIRKADLRQVSGDGLDKGVSDLIEFLVPLGVGRGVTDQGTTDVDCYQIIGGSFASERSKNFISSRQSFLKAATQFGVLKLLPT